MTRAALWVKWRPLALAIAREYRLPGGELQDLEQEALIGLWVAARTFDNAGPFSPWARLVIHRRLGQVLQAALRHKHGPLNGSVREVVDDEGEWVQIVDTLPGGRDPADIVVARETFDRLRAALELLTPYERDCVERTMAGVVSEKRVHNAAWAARQKLREAVA